MVANYLQQPTIPGINVELWSSLSSIYSTPKAAR